MSANFASESEPFFTLTFLFTHPHGSVSKYQVDMSPFLPITELKEDMVDQLGVAVDLQVWKTNAGVVMSNEQNLDDYFVKDGDTLLASSKPV